MVFLKMIVLARQASHVVIHPDPITFGDKMQTARGFSRDFDRVSAEKPGDLLSGAS